MRIDPPPSLAWPTETMPAATAAAEPPDDPPVEWSRFHGLRDGPYASGSVVIVLPNSGALVRPMAMKPASRNRRYSAESYGRPVVDRLQGPRCPAWYGSPFIMQPRSFITIGTPAKGPPPGVGRLGQRAAS